MFEILKEYIRDNRAMIKVLIIMLCAISGFSFLTSFPDLVEGKFDFGGWKYILEIACILLVFGALNFIRKYIDVRHPGLNLPYRIVVGLGSLAFLFYLFSRSLGQSIWMSYVLIVFAGFIFADNDKREWPLKVRFAVFIGFILFTVGCIYAMTKWG